MVGDERHRRLCFRHGGGAVDAPLSRPARRGPAAASGSNRETATYAGRAYPLFSNRWASGAVEPAGYRHIERFRLEGATPAWSFACADALLEKRVWMQPGLTLATGRHEVAASILRTFARYVDRGMLPNRFPDAGETPKYNTVDATLWCFEAMRAYHAATGDDGLLRDLHPVLRDIIKWHRRGTHYGIHVDPADGLLYAGEPGVQLTWTDAKVGDGQTVAIKLQNQVALACSHFLWHDFLRPRCQRDLADHLARVPALSFPR